MNFQKGVQETVDLEEQYDKIYRYCYFKLQHRQRAEDITQETFLRFLESTAYQNQGKMLQYLYTIARHLCMDEFRRISLEQRTDSCMAEEENLQDGADMQERIATAVTVREALEELPEQEREILLLYYVNEVPAAVLAKLMGISRFAVYRVLKKAEKHLQIKLQQTFGKE